MAAMHKKPLSLDHRIAIGATHLGITRAEYQHHILAGEKWCAGCHAWHPRSEFVRRTSKWDGLDNHCRAVVLARVLAYQRRKREGVA
jgi:hypothetical protein